LQPEKPTKEDEAEERFSLLGATVFRGKHRPILSRHRPRTNVLFIQSLFKTSEIKDLI